MQLDFFLGKKTIWIENWDAIWYLCGSLFWLKSQILIFLILYSGLIIYANPYNDPFTFVDLWTNNIRSSTASLKILHQCCRTVKEKWHFLSLKVDSVFQVICNVDLVLSSFWSHAFFFVKNLDTKSTPRISEWLNLHYGHYLTLSFLEYNIED